MSQNMLELHHMGLDALINNSANAEKGSTMNFNPRLAVQAMPSAQLTDRYEFISTQDVVQAVEALGFFIKDEKAARVRKPEKVGYQQHTVVMAKQDETPVVNGSSLRIIIMNNHTGGGSIKVQIGLFRLVCLNGLVVPENALEPLRFRHIRRVGLEVTLQEYIIGKIKEMIDNFLTNVVAKIEAMKLVQLTLHQQAQFAADAAKLLSNNGVSNLVDDTQLLDVRRPEDAESDLFTVFNRIQENGMKGGADRLVAANRRRVHATTRAIRGMSRAHKYNEELFALAFNYAESYRLAA